LNNALFVLKILLTLNEIETNEIKIKTTQDLKVFGKTLKCNNIKAIEEKIKCVFAL